MIDKTQFPKVRCREAFTSKGEGAAVALGKELGVPESKMTRWLREWSDRVSITMSPAGPGKVKVTTTTPSASTKSALARHKKRVEIFAKKGKGKPMLGYVLNAGPEQSEVYITDGPESLVDKIQCFVNTDLKEIK